MITLDSVIQDVERLFGQLPPELQTDAANTAADLKTAAVTAADTAVTKLAPSFAPEIIPLISEALDKIEAEATAKVAAVQMARQALPSPAVAS